MDGNLVASVAAPGCAERVICARLHMAGRPTDARFCGEEDVLL
jgi:hypothetical protein